MNRNSIPLAWTDYGTQVGYGWAKAGTCRRAAEKLFPQG